METEPVLTNLKYQLSPKTGIVSTQQTSQSVSAEADITDGKGLILTNVQIQLIFWGTDWGAQASPSMDEVTQAVQNILSGPYMSGLAEYRGIGNGTLLEPALASFSDPPQTFSDDDVSDLVIKLIATGIVPEPNDESQIWYCVIMPVGVSFNNPSTNGEHSFAFGVTYSFPFDVDIDKVLFAWVMNDGTPEGITTIFSHELVESCTNPDGHGFQILPLNPNSWNEIGDACQGKTGEVNGVTVQAYWSKTNGACVIPGLLSPSPSGAFPYYHQKE